MKNFKTLQKIEECFRSEILITSMPTKFYLTRNCICNFVIYYYRHVALILLLLQEIRLDNMSARGHVPLSILKINLREIVTRNCSINVLSLLQVSTSIFNLSARSESVTQT
jgi:Na+-translocating ferredoxin:NAD+ oxidoreductase RnfA subunit